MDKPSKIRQLLDQLYEDFKDAPEVPINEAEVHKIMDEVMEDIENDYLGILESTLPDSVEDLKLRLKITTQYYKLLESRLRNLIRNYESEVEELLQQGNDLRALASASALKSIVADLKTLIPR